MRTLKLAAAGAAAMATFALAAPANATIYEYSMTDGGLLTIDTEAQSGSWVDAPVQAATVQKLEDIILTKARDLRRKAVAG